MNLYQQELDGRRLTDDEMRGIPAAMDQEVPWAVSMKNWVDSQLESKVSTPMYRAGYENLGPGIAALGSALASMAPSSTYDFAAMPPWMKVIPGGKAADEAGDAAKAVKKAEVKIDKTPALDDNGFHIDMSGRRRSPEELASFAYNGAVTQYGKDALTDGDYLNLKKLALSGADWGTLDAAAKRMAKERAPVKQWETGDIDVKGLSKGDLAQLVHDFNKDGGTMLARKKMAERAKEMQASRAAETKALEQRAKLENWSADERLEAGLDVDPEQLSAKGKVSWAKKEIEREGYGESALGDGNDELDEMMAETRSAAAMKDLLRERAEWELEQERRFREWADRDLEAPSLESRVRERAEQDYIGATPVKPAPKLDRPLTREEMAAQRAEQNRKVLAEERLARPAGEQATRAPTERKVTLQFPKVTASYVDAAADTAVATWGGARDSYVQQIKLGMGLMEEELGRALTDREMKVVVEEFSKDASGNGAATRALRRLMKEDR